MQTAAPKELSNGPHRWQVSGDQRKAEDQRVSKERQTHAGSSSAERITDPYINLDLVQKFQLVLVLSNLLTRPSAIRGTLAAKFMCSPVH